MCMKLNVRFIVDGCLEVPGWRRAISYREARPEVDPNRIGL